MDNDEYMEGWKQYAIERAKEKQVVVKPKAVREDKQFETRCWELYRGNAESEEITSWELAFKYAVQGVDVFERKMKELRNENKAGMVCGECGAFYEGYTLPRRNRERMQGREETK
jgi:hypothetical protein